MATNAPGVAQPSGRALQLSDLAMAIAAVVVVGLMIIPLPAFVLDLLLAVNIGTALTVLLISMYVTEPLQFSVFPALLLVMTLFRLGLNVAVLSLYFTVPKRGVEPVAAGATVNVVVVNNSPFMSFEKVAVMIASRATAVASLAGLVETTTGEGGMVVNFHETSCASGPLFSPCAAVVIVAV